MSIYLEFKNHNIDTVEVLNIEKEICEQLDFWKIERFFSKKHSKNHNMQVWIYGGNVNWALWGLIPFCLVGLQGQI